MSSRFENMKSIRGQKKDFSERPDVCHPYSDVEEATEEFFLRNLPSLKNPFFDTRSGTYQYCPLVKPIRNWSYVTQQQQDVFADWVARTREYVNTLSDEEIRSIEDYQFSNQEKNGYCTESIQECARKRDAIKMPEFRIVKLLEKVTFNAPRPRGDLYIWRGCTKGWWGGSAEPPMSFESRGFTSFSIDFETAYSFKRSNFDEGRLILIKINDKSSPHLLLVSAVNDMEHEIIFPNETIFENPVKKHTKIFTTERYVNQRNEIYAQDSSNFYQNEFDYYQMEAVERTIPFFDIESIPSTYNMPIPQPVPRDPQEVFYETCYCIQIALILAGIRKAFLCQEGLKQQEILYRLIDEDKHDTIVKFLKKNVDVLFNINLLLRRINDLKYVITSTTTPLVYAEKENFSDGIDFDQNELKHLLNYCGSFEGPKGSKRYQADIMIKGLLYPYQILGFVFNEEEKSKCTDHIKSLGMQIRNLLPYFVVISTIQNFGLYGGGLVKRRRFKGGFFNKFFSRN